MSYSVDVFMPSYSQYEVQHYFTRKFFEALERAQLKCRLLEGPEIMRTLLVDPPDFTLCFNSTVELEGNTLLCDWIHLPHVALLLDPAFHFVNYLQSKRLIITCDDKDSAAFATTFGCRHPLFMPHAVERDLSPDPKLDRIYDIVMLATFNDFEKRRREWPTKFSPLICQAMEKSIEATLADTTTSFITHFLNELILMGPEKAQESNVVNAFQEIELYIKGQDRVDLINAIKDHEVHLFGNSLDTVDWKSYFKGKSNIVIHPSVSYIEAMTILKQSKIVLNSSIKNKQGAHERIFSGAASGAVVVTNDNAYMQENFVDNEELLLYRRSDFAGLNDRVNELLSNDVKRKSIADAGRQNVMQHHTWDHRVADLLPKIIPIIEKMKELKD